ncbi:glycosyltransferase [Nocardioides limicola]|uniref:glycosyltransferase n=1 Tax=Nocardioides limicola TaxID=2803368 RepID=UPI00193C0D64|nr:glycosyltransferase [Nocardioides sp. DJM-14]
MRVTVVTESFYPAVDGATTTAKAILDRLIDTGHEVSLIAPGPGLACYRNSSVARVRSLDRPGAQVRAALAARNPELVIVLSPGTVGRKALKHASRAGATTLTVQQAPLRDLTPAYWQAKVVDRSDLMLTTCDWMRAEVARLGVAAPVWAPGVDPVAFAPSVRDERLHDSWAKARSAQGPRVVVGFVGSLHKSHGVRRLVEAAAVPGSRLVIIGDGPQRSWLDDRLPGAKFTGALGTGDLAVAMASMDLLVHPGETLTCAHALREAAASGLPVVAADAGGARDVVRHQQTGLLFDPDRTGDLFTAVSSVVADPRRGLLGERGRELISTRTWASAVDELMVRYVPSAFAAHHPVVA